MNSCLFCHDIAETAKLMESHYFFVVFDIDPIQTGHLLIISKVHVESLTDLSDAALSDLIQLEKRLIQHLETHLAIDGITVIQNNGKLMDPGTHFHVHLVPRYFEDAFWDNHQVKSLPIDSQQIKTLLANMS